MRKNPSILALLLLAAGLPACDLPDPGGDIAQPELNRNPLFVGNGNECLGGATSNDAILFVDDNFHGPCVRVSLFEDVGYGPGNFPTIVGIPNDSLTSVVLGVNVEIVLRADGLLMGQGLLVRRNSLHNLGVNPFDFNDVTSSFYLQRRNETCKTVDDGQVCLFQDGSFNDFKYTGGSERGVGLYPTSMHMGIQNDSVSSFKVGSGAVASLCIDDNFRNCVAATPGDYDAMPWGLPNDQVTSMQVLGSCRTRGGGNTCAAMSASNQCSCIRATCDRAGFPPCCYDLGEVCGT